MQLFFASSALEDLNRIYAFVKVTYPKAVKLAAKRLYYGFNSLKKYPELGYPLFHLGKNFREFLVPFGKGNYIIRYRVLKKKLFVLHLWHNKENRLRHF
ncbi:MAG: hypothetical protein A3G32_00805 [Deltaproteobacteria bacterium RIFCSPLOWO2_12_FULL_40_28]|nr:MAG: hypothetical protein A3C45_09690 [Deltaproteobacteria bacterium RIFCSPHIGHO2_02_FULL_40_28]OGQ19879.1 MAG: hypothetical protein A3E27_06640 [Deltaproteobacteria bacterium RIFCSPHIGHO2_12_FULL_40_32]OGQ39638.1 MAG: hypothetical protein A3I69_06070 [Deltaproteobacteria bacterium RIFCSPLOWO2_02_FULL_40_36]OGQ52894.1 MAG: hypothetical protein A3G32_00805 [Deltaproteobacteria bacterium RIFCSPLOWO2_12_FULL_40_28]